MESKKRELILKSAAKIFMDRGYHNSKTKDIAINAGVSEALLFKLFKSKELLYYEFQKHEFAMTEINVIEEIKKFDSPLKALQILGKGLLEPDEDTPTNIRILNEILQLHQSKFMISLEDQNKFIDNVLVPVIEEGQRIGEIHKQNSRQLANVYWRFILGSSTTKYYFNISTPNEYLDIMLQIFR